MEDAESSIDKMKRVNSNSTCASSNGQYRQGADFFINQFAEQFDHQDVSQELRLRRCNAITPQKMVVF